MDEFSTARDLETTQIVDALKKIEELRLPWYVIKREYDFLQRILAKRQAALSLTASERLSLRDISTFLEKALNSEPFDSKEKVEFSNIIEYLRDPSKYVLKKRERKLFIDELDKRKKCKELPSFLENCKKDNYDCTIKKPDVWRLSRQARAKSASCVVARKTEEQVRKERRERIVLLLSMYIFAWVMATILYAAYDSVAVFWWVGGVLSILISLSIALNFNEL